LKVLRIDEVAYTLTGGDTIKLPTGTESVYVDARPTDPKATVTITGDKGFKEGNNTLTIEVVGSDKKSSATYKLTLVQPKLEGWCQTNADLIKQVETAYQDELIYMMPGYAELDKYAGDIRAHQDCFSAALVKEIDTNY
ncbi:MAG: hypothetical protein ACKOFA_02105, partial [Rhodoluna sp.]